MLTQKTQREEKRERTNMHAGEREREREKPLALWLLFICFFLPLGLLYVN